MKKFVGFSLAFMIFTSLITCAGAYDSTGDYGRLFYGIMGDKARIIACDDTVKNIVIPSEIEGKPVTLIANGAFKACRELESVTIPGSVVKIGTDAFSGCSSLKSVEIPAGTSEISDNAFWYCKSLEKVTISETVSKLGNFVFEHCQNLTSIEVDEKNEQYSSEDGILFNKDKTVLMQYPEGKKVAEYTVSDSVKEIGNYAFMDCVSLERVNIPAGVAAIIGGDVFLGSTKLENINVDEKNEYYCSIDGNLFSKDKTTLYQYAPGKKETQYTIPDSVETINFNAFSQCKNLTSIVIPDSVTYINSSAFDDRTNIKDVYYQGTESRWESIAFNIDSQNIVSSNIHYNWYEPCFEVSGSGNIKNTDTKKRNAHIMIVKYVNGTMQELLKCGEETFEQGEVRSFEEFGSGCKIFVWNSLNDMRPLTK